MLARQSRDQARVISRPVARFFHCRHEIRLHFEQFGEIGIGFHQRIIQFGFAHQNDFNIQRNGFGFQNRRHHAVFGGRVERDFL